MALFKIFKGSSSNLGKTGGTDKIKEGYAYFTPDDGWFYIDIGKDGEAPKIGNNAQYGANRICINDEPVFNNTFIFDCGTASGHNFDINSTIEIVVSGNAYTDDTNTILWSCGGANIDSTATIIEYKSGNAWTK